MAKTWIQVFVPAVLLSGRLALGQDQACPGPATTVVFPVTQCFSFFVPQPTVLDINDGYSLTVTAAPTSISTCASYSSTSVQTPTPIGNSGSDDTTTDDETAFSALFFLTVQSVNSKRAAVIQYLNANGTLDTTDADAAMFELVNSTLYSNGLVITTPYGMSAAVISGSENASDVSTGFNLQDNVLSWQDASFSTGQAIFGIDENGTVQASFTNSLPMTWTAITLMNTSIILNDTLFLDDPTGSEAPPGGVDDTAGFLNGTSGGFEDGSSNLYNATIPDGFNDTATFATKTTNARVYYDASILDHYDAAAVSRLNPSANDPAVAAKPIMLPNLATQFGGVDIRQAQGQNFKYRLFDFSTGGPTSYLSINTAGIVGRGQATTTNYSVPGFMSADSVSRFYQDSVYGESRTSYQKHLSTQFGLPAGAHGFSTELSNSFSEKNDNETYQQYASVYTMCDLYNLSLTAQSGSDIRPFLSPYALGLIRSGNAQAIVENLGTHYMTGATFGGFKRYSAKVDIRDVSITTQYVQALKIKAKLQDPSLGDPSVSTDFAATDDTTKRLYSLISQKHTACVGGTPGLCDTNGADGTIDWYMSVVNNPTVATQQLQRLDELILPTDGPGSFGLLKAAVKSYITDIMNNQLPTGTTKALIIYAPMSYAVSLGGSRGKESLYCTEVRAYQGWYTLGQYAQGAEINQPDGVFSKDPGSYRGIMIKETENVQPGSILQRPTSLQRIWHEPGMSVGRIAHYEMGTLPGFASLGSGLKQGDQATLQDFGSATLVSIDILIPAAYRRMWIAFGLKSPEDGSIWAITGIDDMLSSGGAGVMQQVPGGNPASWLFHATDTYEVEPSIPAYQLDFTKVTVLESKFLADIPIPNSF